MTIWGVIYVVKTFEEQKDINYEQQAINEQQKEINRLSMEKDRREIRPNFVMDSDDGTFAYEIGGAITVTLKNAAAHEVTIIYPVNEICIVKCNEENTEMGIDDDFVVLVEFIKTQREIDIIIMTIIFLDESGREYFQDLLILKNGNIKMTLPKTLL